jgi:hypothetical protein
MAVETEYARDNHEAYLNEVGIWYRFLEKPEAVHSADASREMSETRYEIHELHLRITAGYYYLELGMSR